MVQLVKQAGWVELVTAGFEEVERVVDWERECDVADFADCGWVRRGRGAEVEGCEDLPEGVHS